MFVAQEYHNNILDFFLLSKLPFIAKAVYPTLALLCFIFSFTTTGNPGHNHIYQMIVYMILNWQLLNGNDNLQYMKIEEEKGIFFYSIPPLSYSVPQCMLFIPLSVENWVRSVLVLFLFFYSCLVYHTQF